MKHTYHIIIAAMVAMLASCTGTEDPSCPGIDGGDGIYLLADLETGDISRVSYSYDGSILKDEARDMCGTWEKGDIIKVYETDAYADDDPSPAFTDVYTGYDDYSAQHPYPTTPDEDTYYRFVCIDGAGTSRGVFKYQGLAHTVKVHDDVTGGDVVKLDIKYNHSIRNWERFQGIAVHENPLRQTLMAKQNTNGTKTHLKYGLRMYGHICEHNFQWWFAKKPQASNGVGIMGHLMHIADNCIYMIMLGGFDAPIYAGSTLSLSMPLATTQSLPLYSQPITITIGNASDAAFGNTLCFADPDKAHPEDIDYNIVGYINGWPGILAKDQPVTVTLTDSGTGNVYTWQLAPKYDINFKAGVYYIFDLRDDQWTKTNS